MIRKRITKAFSIKKPMIILKEFYFLLRFPVKLDAVNMIIIRIIKQADLARF